MVVRGLLEASVCMWVVPENRVPLGGPFCKGAVLYWGPKTGP